MSSNTKAMKAKIAIGRKQLGLDEDTYRAMLVEVTGKASAATCNEVELARLVDHLASKGAVFTCKHAKPGKPFRTGAAGRRSDFYPIPDGPEAGRKRAICGMWKELGYDMMSLDTRCRRQFGVAAFHWLKDPAHLDTLARDLNKRVADKKRKAAV